MSESHKLKADEIREIGEAIYGLAWQGSMAKALGVPRQSVGYYLKSGGVNGAQAAGILGLLARTLVQEDRAADAQQRVTAARRGDLVALLARFDPA